ncbi:MAG: hypothetical protein EA380_09085 [Phycisphaeraceae bacterium]|nr:MAG: hypothetical protein EA380_09085 [Phycisphaeraceae bacterium]
MDDRQREVQVGAGLHESRLNTELIDFLQVWGPRVLYVVLAVVLAYIGLQYLDRHREQQMDRAYAELQSALVTGQIDGLFEVAENHRSKNAIWSKAIIGASQQVIGEVRVGYERVEQETTEEPPLLTTEARVAMVDLVIDPLRQVARANSDPKRALFAVDAYWNLTTLLMTKAMLVPEQRDALLDEAKQSLRAGLSGSREAGLEQFAALFENRYEALFGREDRSIARWNPELPNDADLPAEARRPERAQRPPQDPMQMFGQQNGLGVPGATVLDVQQGPGGDIDIEELMRRIEQMNLTDDPPALPEESPAPPEAPESPEAP